MINFKLLVEKQLDELFDKIAGTATGLAVGVKTRSWKKGLAVGAATTLAIKHRQAIIQKTKEIAGTTAKGAGRQVKQRHEERRDANMEVRAAKRSVNTKQRADQAKREMETRMMKKDKDHRDREMQKRKRMRLN